MSSFEIALPEATSAMSAPSHEATKAATRATSSVTLQWSKTGAVPTIVKKMKSSSDENPKMPLSCTRVSTVAPLIAE